MPVPVYMHGFQEEVRGQFLGQFSPSTVRVRGIELSQFTH